MSGHLKVLVRGFFGALALVFLSGNALALTISPSPSYDGNYTVTWGAGCFYTGYGYPYPEMVCTYLAENGVYVSSSSPYYAAGKPEGTHQYDVVEEWYYFQQYVDSGSVIVGTPPPRDPIPTQLTYQYQTREGDINSDGRVDLLVERTSGGVPGNGVLDKVVLWQNTSGSFWPVVDSYYTSIASSWPPSSVTAVIDDLNVDGYVDVALKGVSAATGGGVPYNQIIFSSGAPLQTQPLALRAVDYPLQQLVANSLDYVVNPDYFYWNANYAYFYGYYYYYYCSFYPYYYGGIESYYYGGWGCGIYYDYFSGYYVDYSGFSEQAVAIWTNETANESGALSNAQSTENAQQSVEDVLTVPIGGWPMEEELGTEEGEHLDPDARRGLETFWSILGIARAYPTETPTEEAPQQSARAAGTIWITAHHVFGLRVLPYHTALEYTYPGGVVTETLSAVSAPLPLVGPFLVSRPDRRGFIGGKLSELRNMTFGSVVDYSNPLYWAELRLADSHYDDNLPYLAIPFGPFYNSNGYTNGLILATNGTPAPAAIMSRFVGASHPVPESEFQ